MADKLTIKAQKIFGNTGPTGIVGQFGSYKVNAPVYSLDPDTIQALGAWGEGLNGSCIDSSPPAVQDLNAIFHVISKWIFYMYESGIPDHLITASYYLGSSIFTEWGFYTSAQDIENIGHYPLAWSGVYWQEQMTFNQYYSITGNGSANVTTSVRTLRVICDRTPFRIDLPTNTNDMIGTRILVFIRCPTTELYTITFTVTGTIDGASTKVVTIMGHVSLDQDHTYGFICTATGWKTFHKN